MIQAGLVSQTQHLARLLERARQGLLAGHAKQRPAARSVGLHARPHVREAVEIRAQNPHGIDRVFVGDQVLDRLIPAARTQAQLIGQPDRGVPPRLAVAVDAGDLDVADRLQSLQMKVGDKARAEDADA